LDLDESADGLFSFAHVCETLGFDPAYLRQGIVVWKERHAALQGPAKVYGSAAPEEGSRASPFPEAGRRLRRPRA
jgi:hypothetical protein